jgi:hypothetical protein
LVARRLAGVSCWLLTVLPRAFEPKHAAPACEICSADFNGGWSVVLLRPDGGFSAQFLESALVVEKECC